MIRRALPPMVSFLALVLCACSTAVPYDSANQFTAPPPDAFSSAPAIDNHSVAAASCPTLNTDAADTSVTYTSRQEGLSFTVPYNAKWGYADSPVSAFIARPPDDESPLGSVAFGVPRPSSLDPMSDSCDLTQSYILTFLLHRTEQAAAQAIEGADSAITPTTQTRVINGLTVVQYTGAGTCSYPTMEVIGQKYDYQFSTYCGENSSDEWQYLENIVKSVTLLK